MNANNAGGGANPHTIDEVGFLSPQIDDWIKRHRAGHAEWFSLCENLNEFAQHVMLSFKPLRSDRRLTVVAAVFSRVVSHFQATILLTERGMLLEARVVARAALEATFIVGALLKDKKFVDDYAKDHEVRCRKTITSLLKHNDQELNAIGTTRERLQRDLERVEKIISEEGIKELKVRETARRAQMDRHYESLYDLLCSTVHTRVKDLERGVIMDAGGWPDQIKWGPDSNPDAISEVFLATCDIMFIALRAMAPLSDLSVEERLASLSLTYVELASQPKAAGHSAGDVE
jgi:hypothetical protein